MAKAWVRERLAKLFEALDGLTVAQEDEIKRICEEEREYIRTKPTMKSLSSLKEPMTDMRMAVRTWKFTDETSWFNPAEGKARACCTQVSQLDQGRVGGDGSEE